MGLVNVQVRDKTIFRVADDPGYGASVTRQGESLHLYAG